MTDLKNPGDLFVCEPSCDHFQDFNFSGAQARLGFPLLNPLDDAFRKKRFPGDHCLNCSYDLFTRRILGKIASCACFDRLINLFFILVT